MGYEEIEHTADWALRVWADDLPGLLSEALRGMYHLAGTATLPGPRLSRTIEVRAGDAESLLVGFLEEALFLGEEQGLAFDTVHFEQDGSILRAVLWGSGIESQKKEIKAVTFHNLSVQATPAGLEATIVFDV
jgi:SHS2 domain-containing protein